MANPTYVVLQAPATITSNTNGSSVNVVSAKIATRRKAKMVVSVGNVSGTSPTLVVKLQGSSDGSTWADIPGATTSTISASGAYIVSVDVNKPYIRSVLTVGGTSPSFAVAVGLVADKLS